MRRALVVLLLVAAALIAAPASAPVSATYVYSDSMEPTVPVNGGLLVVPAGDVEPGEIVLFEGGPGGSGYTAHRVVRETPQGFVTKGDNNDVTDQDAGYPHVERSQIHGQVLTAGGRPVVVPHLGRVVQFVRQNTMLLVLLGVAGSLLARRLDEGGGARRGGSERPVSAHRMLALTAVAVFVALTTATTLGATTTQMVFSVQEDPAAQAPAPVIEAGTAHTVNVTFGSGSGSAVTTRVGNARGARIVERTRNASGDTYRVRVPPPGQTGTHRVEVSVRRYPAVLPAGVIAWLAGVHPLLAAAATNGVVIGSFYAVARLLLGPDAPLRSSEVRAFGLWRER
ncbi:S26 family signal peptidase [Halarchaeum sp. CBA1220]|uniref:S26 family signal peptidase n=1 Tax=Halarchaeum sp. CBA1220 TaxID=1853682 RepID=UPI000F3AA16A|nr:S26 family signal peptidase [Halarchaeum sp. CBA1220]QLC33515.1 S26 family signal peptidase [Halarchaeum sp. CBA1220]